MKIICLLKKWIIFSDIIIIYKAGLPRYEIYQNIEFKESEKDCILISFTYRSFNSTYYENSLYIQNIIKLLEDDSLITFLQENNIELIYAPHHNELIFILGSFFCNCLIIYEELSVEKSFINIISKFIKSWFWTDFTV